ncbi:hypothetical protein [Roseateles sp.]|uniref:hypothetical protein n=1 Tax=Roseateles sp. TaxID=1971397 RepID=UPI0039EA921D
MLERTDVVTPLPGMPSAAASAPTVKAGLAASRLDAGTHVLNPDVAAEVPASPALPAERLAQRAGAAGQLVLVRTDETHAMSTPSGPKRRIIVLQQGKLPNVPEPDVLYRMP